MARAFLFYTGFYEKETMPLADGGSITKQQVTDWVDDCIANSGHGLVEDFRNLWPYAYANSPEGDYTYPYAVDNGLEWVGDGNKETVFAVKYSVYGEHNANLSYSNQMVLYMAMRMQEDPLLMPWGEGWGGCPANPQLFESYADGDVRKKGTIIDITDPVEGQVSNPDPAVGYTWGKWEAQQETGFWQKKYHPIKVYDSEGSLSHMYNVILGTNLGYQLANMQDEIIIRFSDVLLMGAELGGAKAQEYYDRVRTRAGLDTRTATLENIKEERRHELAFEGIRHFDLMRWHDMEEAHGKVKDIPIKNTGNDAVYNSTYRPENRGLLPIPEREIALSNGTLEQNPGWDN